MRRAILILPLLIVCSGCPVTQSQKVPVPATLQSEAKTGASYWIYVPKDYTPDRPWPLVVTLHGTHVPPYDTAAKQIDEWKSLAEEKQFIVVAPSLTSTQGVLPAIPSDRRKKLEADDQTILAVLDEVCGKYAIDTGTVLLTGFSSGGFPMYNTGLRHPERFGALVARAGNCDIDMLDAIELTDAARKLPIFIFWGKDDLKPIVDQSWNAFRYLREHKFKNTTQAEVLGGHLRRPDKAYTFWRDHCLKPIPASPRKKTALRGQ